jgi:pimeloyl-ACP methyl ester carboxylesterase
LSPSVSYTRTPYLIVHREASNRKDVYGAIDDAVVLQAQLLRGDQDSDTVIIGMHPIGAPGYLPMFSQLARAGHHVVACATRYSQGDAALQMENVLLDLAACVRDTRDRLGYRHIVLAGWSGGGATMAGYQAEAEDRRITLTAAGEQTPLANAELPTCDALLLIATHRSRHHLLTGQLDASIIDELHPERRDPLLDLYDEDNPEQPPYSPAFLERYRAAQLERNRSITRWARLQLEELRGTGREDEERCFLVHGTMADPRWLDPNIDPNDRRPRWTYLGDPRIVNNSPAALARYTSTRSWLSQWSFDDAQVDIVDAGPRITVPSLLIVASADDACPPSHNQQIFDALGANDKQMHVVEGANHYFTGPQGREHLGQTMELVDQWLGSIGLA